VIALASSFNGFVAGMALGGLGFGLYTAVDLALVADVLPDPGSAAKDLGVMNIAVALPSSVAPAASFASSASAEPVTTRRTQGVPSSRCGRLQH
jgi:MFS family permease